MFTTHPVKDQECIASYGIKKNCMLTYNNLFSKNLISTNTNTLGHVAQYTGMRNAFMGNQIRAEADFIRNMSPRSAVVYQYQENGGSTRQIPIREKNIFASFIKAGSEFKLGFTPEYLEELKLLSDAYTLMTEKEVETLVKIGVEFKIKTLSRLNHKFIELVGDKILGKNIIDNSESYKDLTPIKLINLKDNPHTIKDLILESSLEFHRSSTILIPKIELLID